jgi:site-specific recombinase XerD
MADPSTKTSQPSKPLTVAEKLAAARAWQEKIEKGLKLPNLTADEHALLLTQKRAAAAAVHAYERALAQPHMLRHACGYALANKGHDTRAIQGWLRHRSITSTAVCTE